MREKPSEESNKVEAIRNAPQIGLAKVDKKLSKGYSIGFVALCFWTLITSSFEVFFYGQVEPFISGIWSSPEEAYLQEYRPLSAAIWKFCIVIVDHPILSFTIIIVLLIALCFFQNKLQSPNAKKLIILIAIIETLMTFVIMWCLLHLHSLPGYVHF